MGLDIVAVSKAVQVPCRWKGATRDEVSECENYHTTVGSVYRKKDGIKPGCYVLKKGGREFDFEAGSGSGFGDWRDDLSLFVLSVTAEEVWEHPRRFRGKPFVELIDFPDSMGNAIGPVTAAKLLADFAAFASKAKRHYSSLKTKAEPTRPAKSDKKTTAKTHLNNASQRNAESFARELGGVLVTASDTDWMWEIYQGFRKALKIASDDGFVLFC